MELNLLASSYQTDYYLSGQTNDILLDDDPILDAPTPWRDNIRNIIRDSQQIADYPAGTMRRDRHARALRQRFGDYRARSGGAVSGSAEMPGQPTKRQQWISHDNRSRNAAVRIVKIAQLWQHARQVRADFTIFMEAIPYFEKAQSHMAAHLRVCMTKQLSVWTNSLCGCPYQTVGLFHRRSNAS